VFHHHPGPRLLLGSKAPRGQRLDLSLAARAELGWEHPIFPLVYNYKN
jgi:hypothetical protein